MRLQPSSLFVVGCLYIFGFGLYMRDELLHYGEATVCEFVRPLYLLGLENLDQDLDLVDEVVEEVVDRLGHGQPLPWPFRGVLAISADRHPGLGHLCVD